MDQIRTLIDKYTEQVIQYRRYLHAHPEQSHEEKETAAYIAAALRKMGLEPREHIGGYGVSALIEGKTPGKCVGLRADFDALPVQEYTGLPFSSQNPGVAHACGHDAHTAMLLGAALVLNELRDSLHGSVKLIFQPSEEDSAASGAKAMIADGILEEPHVDGIFGQHVWPLFTLGQVGVRSGAMMASSDRFFITIKGRNSHGSAPESGIDAIVIAAQVVNALQTIVSRNVAPLDSAVVTIGTISGGIRYNVIADSVRMDGTCRNLNPAVRDAMPGHIERIVKGVCESMGGTYELSYLRCYSPTVNDPAMAGIVKDSVIETLGKGGLIIPENSALTGEDFSYYCEKVPGAFYWLGCRREGSAYHPLHHGAFAPEEEAFTIGMEVMLRSALRFLAE